MEHLSQSAAYDAAIAAAEQQGAAKYDGLVAELAKLLLPHLKKAIVQEITNNDQAIVDMIKAEVSEAFEKYDLDTAINSVIDDYNFDSVIEDRCDELGLVNEDAVKELIDDHSNDDYDTYAFRTAVKDAVRDMDIKLQID